MTNTARLDLAARLASSRVLIDLIARASAAAVALRLRHMAYLRTLLALSAPVIGLSYYIGRPWRWFSWHPLLMGLAFVAAASSGILIKRKGGRVNTIIHGATMTTAFVLALCGWYVIREQKKMLGKPHHTTWHSWQGLVAIAGYWLGAAGGLAALHPDFGLLKTNAGFRLFHKMAARVSTVSALLAVASGYSKLADSVTTALVAIALLALAVGLSLFEPPKATKGGGGGGSSELPVSSGESEALRASAYSG